MRFQTALLATGTGGLFIQRSKDKVDHLIPSKMRLVYLQFFLILHGVVLKHRNKCFFCLFTAAFFNWIDYVASVFPHPSQFIFQVRCFLTQFNTPRKKRPVERTGCPKEFLTVRMRKVCLKYRH